jgi:hypothetical protein
MDGRERWQALQARLTAARAAVDAGDRALALSEINAALELDRDFLAAHALRDRIVATDAATPRPASSVVSASQPAPGDVAASPAPSQVPTGDAARSALATGYAGFEQRARRRRVDRRVDAAREAIAQRRLKIAATALDEVIDLDPNLPELADLTAQFDQLRRTAAGPHHGPLIAAAAVFAAALLGASWLDDSSSLFSRQMVAVAWLPAPVTPGGMVSEGLAEVATSGTIDTAVPPARAAVVPREAEPPVTLSPAVLRLPAIAVEPAPVPRAVAPVPRAAEPVRALNESIVAVPISNPAPIPPVVETPDDHALVTVALQRYRKAYEGLDAQSAHAVWPAVNQAALARAFDGLESQSLTFDACDVRLRGEAASATCHGSARYVPKVGSRDPHIEPRVWNFTLRKAGSDWKIDTARAER